MRTSSARAAALAALLAGSVLGGCGSTGSGEGAAGPYTRYAAYLWDGIPDGYAHRTNPLPDSADNIAAGAALYRDHCSACHGASGKGDGPAGADLVPPPANLAFTRVTPIGTDRFFFWTIAEGGASLGTAMPAFGGTLRQHEIWQIVQYLKTGMEAPAEH